ncbi:hypothetical protein BGZ51_008043, partial [Haplosporangium sp. Z 767]
LPQLLERSRCLEEMRELIAWRTNIPRPLLSPTPTWLRRIPPGWIAMRPTPLPQAPQRGTWKTTLMRIFATPSIPPDIWSQNHASP